MQRSTSGRLLAVVAGSCLLAVIAGCSGEGPSEPRPAPAATFTGAPSFFTTSDPGTQSLSTSITGPTKMTELNGQFITYRANVSGGTGPYFYDWWEQYCYTDINFCSVPYHKYSGVGLNSIEIFYPPEMSRMRYIVHVYDAQTYAYAGTANRTTVNMAAWNNDVSSGTTFSCDQGESVFPVRGFDNRYYRRDGCTGARVYP